MALKTLTLLLAATGLGAALYRMGRRTAPEGDSQTSAAPLQATSMPNFGEQLQDMELANVGIGTASNANNQDLLAPPSAEEQQTEDIRPGLPDFARGA